MVWLAEGGGEQPLDFVDGERDQAGVAGRRLVWPLAGGGGCAPVSEVTGLLPDIGQVHRVDAVRDPARAAQVLPLDRRPCRSPASPGPSIQRPDGVRAAQRRAAPSRPAAACFLTWLIAAASSHDARFSSRCAQSGERSPQCSAIDQPFRDGSSLASALTYFPACSQVCVRAKHDRSSPISADRSRSAARAPILAAAAAPCSFVLTNNMITGGCTHVTGIPCNLTHPSGQVRQ